MGNKIIDNKIFQNYILCKYKAYLYAQGKSEKISDYENFNFKQRVEYKRMQLDKLTKKYNQGEILNSPTNLSDYQINGYKLITEIKFSHNDSCVELDALEIEKAKNNRYQFTPIFFSHLEKIQKDDKLSLAFQGFLFSKEFAKEVKYLKVVFGEQGKSHRIKLEPLVPSVIKTIKGIKKLRKNQPQLFLNKHCQVCEFQQHCKAVVKEKDDLSLLRGMSEKEIVKQNKKGIFTVNQLSYNFRPRRKGGRVKNQQPKHYFELKALAIRENKIHVFENPELPDPKVQIYLDIEGNPEKNSHYLIGLVVIHGKTQQEYSLWADDGNQEKKIINDFLDIIKSYDNFIIFYYGSYESKFLQKIQKEHKRDKKFIKRIIKSSCNILSFVYLFIYFPTYSNGLKDVANYLEFEWTDQNSSGIQSLVWRAQWERTKYEEWKKKLIQYNQEDCLALKKVTECIYSIVESRNIGQSATEHREVVDTKTLKRKGHYKWQRNDFVFADLDFVNQCSYFDYQREKIFVRTNKSFKKFSKSKPSKHRKIRKINKVVEAKKIKQCPDCKSTINQVILKYPRTIYDLKVFKDGGIKKQIILYKRYQSKCFKCNKIFHSKDKMPKRWGHNLVSWFVYQNVVNKCSLETVARTLKDIYHLPVSRQGMLRGCKVIAGKYYTYTFRRIMKKIKEGTLIHIDETKINLKSSSCYVWVLTNLEEVVFILRPNREGDFLKEMLKDFHGVLISDFFTAYDSLDCVQQKCLVHLIRDFNDDLLKHPFDEEFKEMVQLFAELLRKVVETVDKYGLKKRNLNKHKKDVKKFFRIILNQKYNSELAAKYQKRFKKNQDKLFTFLNYDGVPWNNNNAERAIKDFAIYRRNTKGLSSEKGLNLHLVLLSINMTCRYKGISFWKFLISKEKDVDKFVKNK